MAVTYFKAESFLFMVLEVLSLDGNYFEMRVISANYGGKGISIDHVKISSISTSRNHRFPFSRRMLPQSNSPKSDVVSVTDQSELYGNIDFYKSHA
jgi:hypothetical protein